MIARLTAMALWPFQLLPFRLLSLCGELLGRGLFYVAASRRRVGEINLALCFPDLSAAQRRSLLQQHFVRLSQMLLEYGYCWFSSREKIRSLMQIEGLEHLQALAGQPVILCMPHFTGLDLAGLRISLETPLVSIYSKQKDAGLDDYVVQKRLRFDTAFLLSRQDGIRPALKALKQGLRFYYLPDQDFGPKDSVFAPFFGVEAATITAMARMSHAARAHVLPCYPRREAHGYTLVIEPPLANYPSGDWQQDARQMNEAIEAIVLKQPAQYFWLHKRFKTRPDGESRYY